MFAHCLSLLALWLHVKYLNVTLLSGQISELQILDSEGPQLRWNDGFEICSVIEGKVHEIKHFGVVISFKEYSDVYGFISHYHCKSRS